MADCIFEIRHELGMYIHIGNVVMATSGAPPVKPLVWLGSSKKDLVALPASVVDVFGYGLFLAQAGGRHENSKVLRGVGDASVVEGVYGEI